MTYVRTYAQGIQARVTGNSSSVDLTMCEIVDKAQYREGGVRGVIEVSITRIRVNRYGYTLNSGYCGTGAPVYDLDFEQDGRVWSHTVRHYDRSSLRYDLKRIFPNAKVSR
jgi:hypothetical protein